ncbi:MAG TPA: M48 family metallopeptidase [Candidatus Limnocylindria bacterium]|nr:M48 family metallopeptidase [Candidatus Limnocylindria bacterium]
MGHHDEHLVVVIGLARRLPRRWPAVAAAAAGLLVVLGSFIYPLVVEPLFNTFTPMHDGALKSRILRLADREHVQVDDVLVADASRRTTRLNAYVSGFGSTRRVVVYDTLLKGLPEDEVLIVVAHELAHAKHRDVALGTALGALGTAFGVGVLGLLLTSRALRRRAGVAGIGDAAVVPLLLLLIGVGSLVSAPVQNTISRAMEAHADRTSLEVTGEYDAFTGMQRQLAVRSLADPTPPAWRQWWFGSHPTALQRIGMAKAMSSVTAGARSRSSANGASAHRADENR